MTTETALPTTDLTPQVREVARLRREHTAIGALLDERTRVFVEAHADDIAHRQALGKQLAEAEAGLRIAAEVLFLQTGEKLPAPGVVVKEKTVFEYDEAEALAWALRTEMALIPAAVDRRALEKIAKATPLDFVTIATEPTVTLAKDLDGALATLNGAQS